MPTAYRCCHRRTIWSVADNFSQVLWQVTFIRSLSHQAIAAALRPHRYSPLVPEAREIRLLSLLPAERNDPIEGVLKKVSLQGKEHHGQDRVPSWSCLSYSWRNFEEQKELIWVDDQPFLITSNLHGALQHLRSKKEPQILWIDQICIDQRNTAERSRQVRMIGDIFQSANSVLAWLGANDWATRTAIDLVSHLTEEDLRSRWSHAAEEIPLHLSQEERHGRWLLQKLWAFLEDDANEQVSVEKRDMVLTRLFSRFLQNPWFDRLWIIQEAALAKTLSLHSGPFWASWDAFEAVIDSIHLHSQKSLTPRWQKFTSIHSVREATVRTRSLTTQFSPSALARHHRHRLALDDRDKIFSLIGLCKIPSMEGSWIDYDRTVESVYASFTRRCIRHERTLNVLNGCCGALPKMRYTVPSWATDWTKYSTDSASVDDKHCGLDIADPLEVRRGRSHGLTDGDSAVLERSRYKTSISLRGHLLDTIKYVCDSAHHPNLVQEPSSTTWDIWEEQIRQCWSCRPQHNRVTLDEMFWRTMSATHDGSELPDIRDQWKSWWSRRTKTDKDEINDSPVQHDCSDWLAWLRRTIRPSSRIFITKGGHLGLTCEHARPGDSLCFLYGGRNLFLLRKQDQRTESEGENHVRDEDKYILIGGETFVESLSTTQALRNIKEAGTHATVFCLV